MGDLRVRIAKNQKELNHFTRHLLRDIQALETMLEEEWFENENMKIGAEQEICLIDDHGKPSPKAMEVLEKLKHPNYTTELARFNIEANIDPLPFHGTCFSDLEKNILGVLDPLKDVLSEMDIQYVLTGILPTLRKFDLTDNNLTPLDRYFALMESLKKLRGREYELRIEGLDELNILHESALLEACNTSFQIHLQIKPDEFVQKYNTAMAISGPVLAVCSNSPLLFGKRLWNETRIALFRQSIDTRVASEHLRERSPRVMFGNDWLYNSILDLYKEDIMRFRVLLMTDIEEDAVQSVANGVTPKLRALNIHNSTVYRWNRPCYGVANGVPHLRIENRLLPAGPTVTDEVANAAFWIGLMNGFDEQYPDITKVMDFDDAKDNFLRAARSGMNTQYSWVQGQRIGSTELFTKELLPLAREGLRKAEVSSDDISKYMDIIEERVETGRTGSTWILNSFSKLIKETGKEEVMAAITCGMRNRQIKNIPVAKWDLAGLEDINDWEPSDFLVEEFMATDLITVSPQDVPEFAADIMEWMRFRYLPVENNDGCLIGLVSYSSLLRYFAGISKSDTENEELVEDIMIKSPITVSPEATIVEAMNLMHSKQIGCLPVEANGNLVGVITEANFLNITASLLKRIAKRRKDKQKKNGQQPSADPATEEGGTGGVDFIME